MNSYTEIRECAVVCTDVATVPQNNLRLSLTSKENSQITGRGLNFPCKILNPVASVAESDP